MLKTKASQLSFYGDHIYGQVIPDNHLLKLPEKTVDFSFANQLCRDAYTPDLGRSAYGPEMMFKMIFPQFLYDVSERRIKEEVNLNLLLKGRQGRGKQRKWYNIII
jgi:IS5 family transposase